MNKTKQEIINIIKDATSADVFRLDILTRQVTADSIAIQLHISRSSASQYLNELFKENRLVKISTRPVLFLHKDVISIAYGLSMDITEFTSLSALIKYVRNYASLDLNEYIGEEGSLKPAIESALASIAYPPYGIEMLVVGNFSSGRSLFSRYVYNKHVEASYTRYSDYKKLHCNKYMDSHDFIDDLLATVTSGLDRTYNVIYIDEIHLLTKCDLDQLT